MVARLTAIARFNESEEKKTKKKTQTLAISRTHVHTQPLTHVHTQPLTHAHALVIVVIHATACSRERKKRFS